ncbi:NAD(P)-binding domain-containing protein [Corynebacterium suedekumii]|nr:NAD(P)-binding domain-containing protein [Corynebacterium suedekumii]
MGSAIARLAVGAGMEVIVSNSRGPESLADLVAELGPSASAGTAEEAIRDSDAVVLSVPLLAVRDIPVDQLGEKLILDTSNYYPYRDGRVPVLDDNSLTTGELVRNWLGGARVVKAFSNILAHHIPQLARPAGAPDRTALPVASDDPAARREAAAILDRLGFDVVDAGDLAEAWRFEPESAGYTWIYLADEKTPDEQLMSSTAGPTPVDEVTARLDSAVRVETSERKF